MLHDWLAVLSRDICLYSIPDVEQSELWVVLTCSVGIRVRTEGYRAFSLPGQFTLWSKLTNKILANSLPGPFTQWSIRSLKLSLPGMTVLRNFYSLELLFSGTFAPIICKYGTGMVLSYGRG